jgi:hypothetical protein
MNATSDSLGFDMVTFGETMVLFAPAERGTLEGAPVYHGSIGGAESNCAIGLGAVFHRRAVGSREIRPGNREDSNLAKGTTRALMKFIWCSRSIPCRIQKYPNQKPPQQALNRPK